MLDASVVGCVCFKRLSEVGGVSPALVAPKPGNRFRFRFVFVSCVHAGEAKLRGRVRMCFSTLVARPATFPAPPPALVGPRAGCMLFAKVLRIMLRFCC